MATLGYEKTALSARVMLNLDFARASIYDQAVLEGVATTYPQTETIIENGIVSGMTATDVQKILNLKHAWEFILDKNVLSYPTEDYILCHIAKLVNEGFWTDPGRPGVHRRYQLCSAAAHRNRGEGVYRRDPAR